MPDVRARTVLFVALAGFGLVMAAVLTFGTPSLRTSDDAEMMAAVSGYDGGARRPELLFTSVLIGRVLVALYDAVPAAPWYGLYLHGLQLVALVAITLSAAVLLRGSPRTVVAAVGGALLLTAANAMMAVQFTIVGILLALAGGLSFMALRATGRGPLVSGAAGGLLLWLAFLVRVQAFGLGLLLIGLVVLVRAVVRREADVVGWIVLAGVVASLAGAATVAEERWWLEEVGAERPLPVWSTGLQASGSGRARTSSDRLSDNDRALVANWLIWPNEMFAFAADGATATGGDGEDRPPSSNEGRAADGVTASARRAEVGALTASALTLLRSSWWALLLAMGIVLASGRRRRALAGAAVLLAGSGLLVAVGTTRLPDRVALPMLLGLTLGTAIASAAVRPDHEPQAPPGQVRRGAGLRAALPILALLVAIPPQADAIASLSTEASWRRDRAEAFLAELAELPGRPTVVLWLIDAWHALHPLGWDQAAKYPVDAVQLAGWQFVLPYRALQRDDLGLSDWIAAVADREDVLLVAEEDRVLLLQTLLRERRGRLCTEVDVVGTVRGDRELLVRRFVEVPCQGVVISP